MNLSQMPRPSKWPYFTGDAVLLALACYVGLTANPLSSLALSIIFGCVALGALLAAVPYLLDALAEQRAADAVFQQKLEAQNQRLAHATEVLAATAAQIKAAHDAAAKAVHAADALPYKLQEKIAEFTNQLQEREDEDKAAMAKELDLLRDTEGQRLTALVGTIQSATKEFAAIEKEARAALEAARREATEAAPALAAALGAATTRAEAALNQSSTQAQNAIGATEARAREAAAAAESIADRLLERTAALRQLEQEITSGLQQKIEQLHAAAHAIETAAKTARRPRAAEEKPEPAAGDATPSAATPATEASAPATALPVMQLTAFPRAKREPAAPRAEAPESSAVESTLASPAAESATAAAAATPAASIETEPAPASEPPPKREPRRKSSARSVGEAVLPGFAEPEIVYDAEPATHSAPAKTADGTTRLLVTAYIGIGNKVFIRGEGPGLSWDKGVPMEFVSIGKWSWETSDAIDPLKIQLFKNDDLAAQGEAITLPPGHHIEATPVFRAEDPF
ncbi:MAG TPA: hypothetical protein VK178_11245 [Opitutaceae bacterium]|nr:hypothetical protein [Opitutaceae bacterium]